MDVSVSTDLGSSTMGLVVSSALPLGAVTLSWCACAAAMLVVTALTVGGNAAVLVALKRARPRFPAHYPLASLALADLMLGLLVLPLAAARELFVFQLNWALCACWCTLDVLCSTASILSLCTLGWERWAGITDPLARARRSRRAKVYSLMVWPVAAAVALPTALVPSPVHPGDAVKACEVNTNIVYVFFSISFSFYLPASGMIFLYARILMALAAPAQLRRHRGRSPCKPDLHKQASNCNLNTPRERSRTPLPSHKTSTNITTVSTPKSSRLDVPHYPSNTNEMHVPSPVKASINSPGGFIPRQQRATQIIVRLMFLFLVCWTPFFVMLPIDSLCNCASETAWQVCTWLGYMNSALDPLVYAAASPTVLRALRASITLSTSSKSDVPSAPGRTRF